VKNFENQLRFDSHREFKGGNYLRQCRIVVFDKFMHVWCDTELIVSCPSILVYTS